MIRSLKKNTKGFTLVELLAVIVILAVLIVIAMPSVLKIMENARRSAFETEVKSYLKAAQTQYANDLAEGATTGATAETTYTSAGTNKLETIENKSGYKYSIKIVSSGTTDGSIKYQYEICSNDYVAKTDKFGESDAVSVSINAGVTANPNAGGTACELTS